MKKKIYSQPAVELVSLQSTAMILAGSNITINPTPISGEEND